mgnify:CR=1 FL=1
MAGVALVFGALYVFTGDGGAGDGLLVRNLLYHWRGNLAVLLGMALGTLSGGLLLGAVLPALAAAAGLVLLALPGHLAGDFRYAQLLATTLAAALMAYTRPGRLAILAAALFL